MVLLLDSDVDTPSLPFSKIEAEDRHSTSTTSGTTSATLQGWTRSSAIRAGLAQRARIVLLSGEGLGTTAVAERVGVSRPTVILWRNRYLDGGVDALADLPRPGRKSDTDEAAIVIRTLEAPPEQLGVTHWSSRLLAREMGVSNVTIAKVWRKWGLQPWRTETFKFSTDPDLDAKVRDVVGLYLNPPEKAIAGAGAGPDRTDPAAAPWPTRKTLP